MFQTKDSCSVLVLVCNIFACKNIDLMCLDIKLCFAFLLDYLPWSPLCLKQWQPSSEIVLEFLFIHFIFPFNPSSIFFLWSQPRKLATVLQTLNLQIISAAVVTGTSRWLELVLFSLPLTCVTIIFFIMLCFYVGQLSPWLPVVHV